MGCLSLCHVELSLPTQKKLEKANFFSESPLSENEIRRSGNDFSISENEVGTVPTSFPLQLPSLQTNYLTFCRVTLKQKKNDLPQLCLRNQARYNVEKHFWGDL